MGNRIRTLALLDIENLLHRWPDVAVGDDYGYAILRATAIADLRRTSHVVMGMGSHNKVGMFAALAAWPGASLRCLRGLDGGELSLLRYASDIDAIARSYGRVIIGSGDGQFTEFAQLLAGRDVPTVVVSWGHKLSRRLRDAAVEVRLMDDKVSPCSAVSPRSTRSINHEEVVAA